MPGRKAQARRHAPRRIRRRAAAPPAPVTPGRVRRILDLVGRVLRRTWEIICAVVRVVLGIPGMVWRALKAILVGIGVVWLFVANFTLAHWWLTTFTAGSTTARVGLVVFAVVVGVPSIILRRPLWRIIANRFTLGVIGGLFLVIPAAFLAGFLMSLRMAGGG